MPFAETLVRQSVGNGGLPTERVQQCRDHLLTSYGLRSLSLDDPRYCGTYTGGTAARGGYYHQGTVWAWLLGHYAIAEYRTHGSAACARERLEAIADHLTDAGLGKVSEISEAEPAPRPGGCPSQACSVACILYAWLYLREAETGIRPVRRNISDS